MYFLHPNLQLVQYITRIRVLFFIVDQNQHGNYHWLQSHFCFILTRCPCGKNTCEEVKCWELIAQDLSRKILYCYLLDLLSSSFNLRSITLVLPRFLFGTSSGKCLELRRSQTILLATAWTFLFWLWECVSSQSMLFKTNTDVLPSRKSFMARSKKCFSTSWIAYFIILSRHNPYLYIPSTSLKQNKQFQFTKIDIIASSHVWWDKSREFIWNDLC